ncbi:MAG: ATP-binding protein [Candidatus Omnitrophota bacterium]
MKTPIHYKITFILSIVIAVIFCGTYLYLNKNLSRYLYQRIENNLVKEVSLVKLFLEKSETADLDKTADEIGKRLSLRVTVIDVAGKVLGDSDLNDRELPEVENHLYRPEVQAALQSGVGESRHFSATVQKDMLYVASVYWRDGARGIVRLSIPVLEIELMSLRLKKVLTISFLAALVFAVIISFLFSLYISKPLREISWAARSIAAGDFSKRITLSAKDEMGDLAKAFNYMTEQIKMRIQEVTTSKLRLEAVLLSMFEGVMVVGLDKTILLMNDTLKEFFMVKENPIARKPIEVVRNVEMEEIIDIALKLKEGQVEEREITLRLPEEKILLLHATPVIREKKIEAAVLVFHDITRLRLLEAIRRDFAANVSHELRTPVTNIKGYSETLLEGALEDKENAKEFLKIIHNDAERLAVLIDDILDLSRLESGKLKLDLIPCSVKNIAEQVVSNFKKQAQDRLIKINIDVPEGLSQILADKTAVSQILLNLVDNAVKYNKINGTVSISAREEGAFARITVADTGIGIPEKDLPRIFERFYRVDKARSRELGGTGLGLSIVKHLVHAHKGEVFVRSIINEGSSFTVTIPKT